MAPYFLIVLFGCVGFGFFNSKIMMVGGGVGWVVESNSSGMTPKITQNNFSK